MDGDVTVVVSDYQGEQVTFHPVMTSSTTCKTLQELLYVPLCEFSTGR